MRRSRKSSHKNYRERGSLPDRDWFMRRVKKHKNGCWEMLSVDLKPLRREPIVKINGKTIPAARWVYDEFNDESLGELLACHTCDTRWCVNPAHLFAGTYSDNVQDSLIKGRWQRSHKQIPIKIARAVMKALGKLPKSTSDRRIQGSKRDKEYGSIKQLVTKLAARYGVKPRTIKFWRARLGDHT